MKDASKKEREKNKTKQNNEMAGQDVKKERKGENKWFNKNKIENM